MIGNNKLSSRQELFLKFKGTPPQEDHKTGFSVFTIIESALFGQVGIIVTIGPIAAPEPVLRDVILKTRSPGFLEKSRTFAKALLNDSNFVGFLR
jgi:hypothetical protein